MPGGGARGDRSAGDSGSEVASHLLVSDLRLLVIVLLFYVETGPVCDYMYYFCNYTASVYTWFYDT